MKKWIVENKDFREMMTVYNKPWVLLYLDPRYLDVGKVYRFSFKINDLWDLKKKIDEHSGSYLLNLSMNDPEMIEIFGKSNKVTEHFRPTTKDTYENGNRWGGGTGGNFHKNNS